MLVAASLGTPWEVDTRGAILLVEEVDEPPYRIDRLLQQLRAAGKLARLAGIGIGAFTGCADERYPEPRAEDVVAEIARALRIPLVHRAAVRPLPRTTARGRSARALRSTAVRGRSSCSNRAFGVGDR